MLGYPATETSQSAFTGWNANDDLVELFANADPNGTDTTSFYTITPAGTPSDVFTLSLAFGTASFNGLATNPAGLKVFANLISDTAGNNLPADVEDDEQYAINYFDFKIDGASFVLGGGSPTQSTVADATMDLNMLDFIEQESFQQVPTFGFVFTFSKELNTSSVSIDDFSINLGKQTITYSIGGSTTSEIYDFSDPDNSDISFNNTNDQITLAFKLTESMQKYGFDLNGDLSVQINSNSSEILDNENGSKVGSDSPTLSYQIKSKMPRLTSFELEQATNSYTTGSISTNYYSTFAGADASNDPVTFYGYKLKLSFDEEVESLISTSSISEYSDDAHTGGVAYYTSRQFLEYGSDYASVYTLPNTTSDEYTNYFPGTRSLFTNPISAASTIWYFYAYLTPDTADFTNNVSEHNYTLLYDATGVSLSGNTDYPHLLRASSNLYLVDADGNPVRVPDSWLFGGSNHGLLSLDVAYDSQPPELIGASALNVDDLDNDGIADDYNGTYGTYGDTATFAFELTFSEEVGNNSELSAAIDWNVTSGTTISSGGGEVTGPVVTGDQYVYTLSNEVSGLFDASGNSGQYSISFNGKDLVDTVGNAVDTSAANTILARDLCASGFCSYENAYVGLVSASANPSSQLVNPGTGTSNAANITFTLVFSQPVTLTQSDPSSIFSLTFYEALAGDQVGNAINLNDTFPNLANVDDDGNGYAYTYTLSVEDDDVSDDYLWALYNYDNLFTAATDTELNLLLLDSVVEANSGFNFLNAFHSAQDVYPAIPATIQSEFAASADPSSSVGVYFLDGIPEVDSAEAVAANSSNRQSDNSDVKRHIAFTFSGFNSSTGDGFGMHMLFRTSDDAFTTDDPSTAPYYGAEGGIYISGQQLDQNNVGYHICPPFSKHLDRIGTGMQHTAAASYNANRMKIHYLAIPYDAVSASHLYSDDEIKNLNPTTVDFTGSLDTTEPCVRTAFYNDGTGQYGYVVDSDMEEQHMVIANAMLQDTHGDTANLAMLPTDQLEHVYFDLYSKDYYNDSWRKDHKITAEDLLTDLSFNINSDALHNTDDLTFQIAEDAFSIFASRFINSINARFLDSVFLDDFTNLDIPAYSQDWLEKYAEFATEPAYANVRWDGTQYGRISDEDDYLTPNYRNQTPDVLVDKNDNRLVLSIGVHPAAIWVTAGSGFFQPFESNQANFLKMNPAFYGLYYGGDSSTLTEPAFDYTSRHLAYVNFDLVYELTIDDQTQEITGATLVQIVSPFTLLKHSFFSSSELQDRQTYGETYTAVAASIADNVFRHNFTGTNSNDTVQHFLPYGVYCRLSTSSPSNSTCYNDHAQMLLPDPDDTGNHARTISSPHNLHRGVLYLENTTAYSPDSSSNDTLGGGGPALLQRFMRLQADHYNTTGGSKISASANPYTPGAIGDYAYSTMLYNSFNRDHAHHYTYSSSAEDFDKTFALDDDYATADGYEQQYWGISPYAESPDARADQILPNAFFLGFPLRNHYHHNFTVQPYQHTSFVQQINSALADPDYLFNKNTYLRGLHTSLHHDHEDMSWAGANSFNVYPSFIFPSKFDEYNAGDGSTSPRTLYEQRSSFNFYDVYVLNGRHQSYFPNIFDEAAHILGVFPHTQENTAFYRPVESHDYETFLFQAAHAPQYYSGRSPGYSSSYTSFPYAVYALGEQLALRPDLGSYYGHGMIFRSADGASYPRGGETELMPVFQSYNHDGTHYAGVIDSDVLYDGGNIQRMLLPHHLDDFDFDRGQILANKLGFFVDTGHTMDNRTYVASNGTYYYSYVYSRLFFPADPTITTTETATTDYIAKRETRGKGTVTSYYPLVLANESLHTADASWPLLLTSYPQGSHIYLDTDGDRAYNLDGSSPSIGSADHALKLNSASKSTGHLPIALDKIFPEGYRYQLGFVNREELFMYDPTVGNGDSDTDPVISRFYSSAVGHFGYATQYSRLNRRSMQGYHLSTSSQFLGDHLARFETEPTSGAHTPNNLSTVFDHTPVNQGATGTNYGSYGDGHYNLTTATTSQLSSTWRHRTYQGNLRGYVLEMRTHPIENNFYEEIQGTGASSITFPSDGNGLTDMNSLNGEHPDGNP